MTVKPFVLCTAMLLSAMTVFGADQSSEGKDSQQAIRAHLAAQNLPDSIVWFYEAISRLPSDEPVAPGQRGYNNYTTQKDHWLGWLDPKSGTGTYPRKSTPDRDARFVYNHIVEPQMLLWLISASGVDPKLVKAATEAAEEQSRLASKSAAIRRHVPWSVVEAALLARD